MDSVVKIAPEIRKVQVPQALHEVPGWLMWRYQYFSGEVKPRKIPYWVDGTRRHGKQGAPMDCARLTTFVAAREGAARKGYDGVGFAPLADFGLTFLDFDNCVDVDGKMPAEIGSIVSRTYAEFSPSGKGIRAALKGDLGNHKSPTTMDDYGFETFSSSGFVTFTGNILPVCDVLGHQDTIADVDDVTRALCERRFGARSQAVFDPEDFMAGREPRLNLTPTKMQALLAVLDPSMGREPWLRIGFALHHETEGDDTGFELWDEWSSDGDTYPGTEGLRHQWDSFKGGTGKHLTTMRSVIKMAKEAGYSDTEFDAIALDGDLVWLDPVPLPDGLLAVPNMDSDMLPLGLQPWLNDIATRMSVPLDFVGSTALLLLGSILGRKIAVRPEQHTNWSEPANVWGCIVAPPGALKSPAIREVFAPLHEMESEAHEANIEKLKAHETELAVHKIRQADAQKKAKDLGDPLALLHAFETIGDPPPRPKLKRFVTSNVTVEKLGEICGDNPDGVLYHRDELLSLLAELDRKEKVADRGFMMTGWSGQDRYTFDRIGRGTTSVAAVTISLFGTAQPNKIAGYVSASLANNDDGMVQRIQILVWPDMTSGWEPMDFPSDDIATTTAFQLCRRLAKLRPDDVGAIVENGSAIPYLRLSDEAREVFVQYRRGLEAKVRGRSLSPPLAAHLSKYRGLVPRIALIMHLASGGTGSVSVDAIIVAIRWADYLEAHARRVYAAAEAAPVDTAKLIWKLIESKKIECGFTARDIYTQGWSQLKDKAEVERGLGALVHAHWLAMRPEETGGRPTVRYYINPKTGNLTT
jgi:hypothetical protein